MITHNRPHKSGMPYTLGCRCDGVRTLNAVGQFIYGYEYQDGKRKRKRRFKANESDVANAWMMRK